jgi:hypothetical protein
MNGTFGGGTGTVTNPYILQDVADIQAIRTNTTKSFKMGNDIDMVSAGNFSPIASFTGNFDGQYFKIKNMKVVGSGSVGMFSALTTATQKVSNIIFENCSLTATAINAGMLCGQHFGGATISDITTINCTVSSSADQLGGIAGYGGTGGQGLAVIGGTVTGTNIIGGIFGLAENTSPLSDSYSTCKVVGVDAVGGLIGQGGKIDRCYASGAIEGTNSTGGLVGISNSSTIKNSFALNPYIARRSGSAINFGDIKGSGTSVITTTHSLDTMEFRQL